MSKDVIKSYEDIRDGLDSIWDRFGEHMNTFEILTINFVVDWIYSNRDQVVDYFYKLNPYSEEV